MLSTRPILWTSVTASGRGAARISSMLKAPRTDRLNGGLDTERRIAGAQRLQTLSWDEARRTRAIVGTPEISPTDRGASSGQWHRQARLADQNGEKAVPAPRLRSARRI